MGTKIKKAKKVNNLTIKPKKLMINNDNSIIREFALEGLDCVNCAAKIENKLNQLQGVAEASLNFMTNTLIIRVTDDSRINDITSEAKAIIKKVEPDVVVNEKIINKGERKILVLQGLCCANCAAKIERGIRNIPGIKGASVDFVSKKLAMEIADGSDEGRIIEESREIIKRIEPEVNAVLEEALKTKEIELVTDNKKEIIKLSVGAVLFGIGMVFKFPLWIEFLLYLTSYILVGGEVLIRAAKNIARGQIFDENFLMGIATIGAFSIRQFPEGVAVMLFYQIGEFFQDLAVNRSRKSIASLMDIRPDFANVKAGEEIKRVTPEEVRIGDLILIKPGEKIPLDGTVTEGESLVDTSALTGESVPREVQAGSSVLGGFINKNGLLTVRVAKEFGQSTVAKILDMVQNASSKKAPTENFVTKFARYYTPVVVFSALALAVIPPLFIRGASFSVWLYRALVFLVDSCPCALVVSIPLGFFGGIGAASKNGILVKGGNYLEALNNVELIVFDKTGTLTKGIFDVTEINETNRNFKGQLLEYAAYAECHSNHPIAASILKSYAKEIDRTQIKNFNEISGEGIRVKVKGKEILAGNVKLMEKENIKYSKVDSVGTVIHVAADKQYIGYIVISDEVKEDSARTIAELKSAGIKKAFMLTGDNKAVGEKIGNELGLDEIFSELLPDEKVEKVEQLSKQKSAKGKLVYVGDGINDAPVLARADIGIAMGGVGSDAAIEAADVVIMTDEPWKIVSAIKIGKRTKNIVMQNIVFALSVKIIILILGAVGIASMWAAVFGDVGVALIAVLNAMRAIKANIM